jgi:hypothetical protein
MKFAPNNHRTALHLGDLPDGPLTDWQRAIADAVRGCHSLADFASAPAETVTAIEVCRIPWGTWEQVADQRVRHGIADARARIDRLEALYRAYGSRAFAGAVSGVDVRGLDADTRRGIVVNLLRRLSARNEVLVRAGDRPVSRAPDGSGYVVAA